MSQLQLPEEFVTICSCVQEEIKTNNSHAFLNLSSFTCILSYDFFAFLRQKELCFTRVYMQLYLLNITLKSWRRMQLLPQTIMTLAESQGAADQIQYGCFLIQLPLCCRVFSRWAKLASGSQKNFIAVDRGFCDAVFCVCISLCPPVEMDRSL